MIPPARRSWPSTHRVDPPEIAARALPTPGILHLLVTYVALVPLLIFAVHGGFSFEHGSWNSSLGAIGGKMAVPSTASETLRDTLQSWLGLTTCAALALPFYRQVSHLFTRLPLMLILPLYATASASWSQDAMLTLRSGLSLLLMSVFALYLASRFSPGQQLRLLMVVGSCVGVGSILMVVIWPQFGIDHQLHEGAWQGLFTQKNACAEAMLFLMTPALALSSPGRYSQLLRCLYIALCLGVILMSQSRTGWAMTLLYLAFVAGLQLLGRFGRRDLLPLAALGSAAVGAAVVFALNQPSLFLTIVGRTESVSGRAQVWSAILASILRNPLFGYGYEAFWSILHGEASRIFAAVGWVVTSAHNGFLNVALELGIVGLVLVLITMAQALRQANAVFHPGHSRYIDWCIGILFLTIVYNFDERTLLAAQYLPWVLYVLACTGLRLAVDPSANGTLGLTANEAIRSW